MQTATIIGAGAFGAWIAHALHQRGWSVTLVDQHGPANSRASSGGETRIIRSGYGALSIYARWARESLAGWLALEQQIRQRIFARTGALFLGGSEAWLRETEETLRLERIPADLLSPADLRRRYPQMRFESDAGAVFEPEAGVLFARRAVQALVGSLAREGVRVLTTHVDAKTLIEQSNDDALVFATGAWLPGMFPDVLRGFIVPTRQEVFFFGPPPGDPAFSPAALPAWVAFDEGIYGLPDLEHRGAKVAVDAHGPPVDPKSLDRLVDPDAVARIRELLRRRIPDLADAPLLESRVCQYENTPDGHFLIDRLPGHDHVWIAGGGSGHGFKHGPAIGRYTAELIEGQRDLDALFALAGRPARQRRVY
ncbi:MAG TPA: FAD-dependent oxidoreductase [Vicinamibacterales bacterium]|nr:FAD-dependent oxidoreductase [Vicinamibacterales bacterium]